MKNFEKMVSFFVKLKEKAYPPTMMIRASYTITQEDLEGDSLLELDEKSQEILEEIMKGI